MQILAAYLAHLYITEEEDFMSLVPDCRILVRLDCDLRLPSGLHRHLRLCHARRHACRLHHLDGHAPQRPVQVGRSTS